MTDYVIMEKLNWGAILLIIVSSIMAIASMVAGDMLYLPIFDFFMPFYRAVISFILWMNFVIWLIIAVFTFLDYKPAEKRLEVQRGKR